MVTSKEQIKLELRGLSPRTLRMLKMVAEGDSNTEIAYRMGLSVPSVEHAMADAFRGLGARTRCHAVALAMREGLMS